MRKTIIFLSIFFSILAVVCPSRSAEVTPEAVKWLFGTWLGVLEGPEQTRSMEVKEIALSSDGRIIARALYGITDGKMLPISINLISEPEVGIRLSFESPAKPPSKIDVIKATESRLDGTFERNNQKRSIRFWKLRDKSPDSKVSAFLGNWEGTWSSNVSAHLTVEYIDLTGASVRYEHGSHDVDDEYGPKFGPGWARFNARITADQNLEVDYLDRSHKIIYGLTADHKYINGIVIPGGNKIRMKRVAP